MAIDIQDKLWQQANCKDEDTEVFFPEDPATRVENTILAKSLCGACSIKNQCLEYAIDTKQDFGIWGGMTPIERQRFKRAAKVKPLVVRTVSSVEKERLAKVAAEANARRSKAAAYRVVKQLRRAINVLGNQLPSDVQEIIDLRMKNPDLSLRDIGAMLTPPVSKDVVSGKIRKTIELAKRASE